MNKTFLSLLVITLTLSFSPSSKAAVIVNAIEQEGNVVFRGEGTLNTNDFPTVLPGGFRSGRLAYASAIVLVGEGIGETYLNLPIFGPNVIGGGATTTVSPSSSSGDSFGINGSDDFLFTPQGYTSGDQLNGSMTFNNTTLLELGLTPGTTYVWTWGSGDNADSYTLNVAVPEPLTILGAGTAIAFGTGFKRKLAQAKRNRI